MIYYYFKIHHISQIKTKCYVNVPNVFTWDFHTYSHIPLCLYSSINQPIFFFFVQTISDWLVDINHKSVMYYICIKNLNNNYLIKKLLAIKKPGRALTSDGWCIKKHTMLKWKNVWYECVIFVYLWCYFISLFSSKIDEWFFEEC